MKEYFSELLHSMLDYLGVSRKLEEMKLSPRLHMQIYGELEDAIWDIGQKVIIKDYKEKTFEMHNNYSFEERLYFYNCIASDRQYINNIFLQYAVMYDFLKNLVENTLTYKAEIILLYKREHYEIEKVFHHNFGEITSIKGGSGDQHDGKSVSIINFEFGQLMYKPRSLNNDILLQKILLYFATSLSIDSKLLCFPAILNKQDHAWQEKVKYSECGSMSDVQSYFLIAGLYLATFYLLNSFDMHYENVICGKTAPVIIDCETISRAKINDEAEYNSKSLINSVLNTCFIPFVDSHGVFDFNLSGLFSLTCASNSMKSEILALDPQEDFIYIMKPIGANPSQNIVNFNSQPVSPVTVLPFLVDGFSKACEVVLLSKAKFINLIESFAKENIISARQLLRPTHIYHKFLVYLKKPSVLCNYDNLNELLDVLKDNFTPAKHAYIRVNYEIEQLKLGNIPLFYTTYLSKDLLSDGHIICKNYFSDSIFDEICQKINQLSNENILYQVRLIKMSIGTLLNETNLSLKKLSLDDRNSKTQLAYDQIKEMMLEQIVRHAKYLMDNTVQIQRGTATIFTLQANADRIIISQLKNDLYQSGGIVWFLASYGFRLCDNKAISIAEDLLRFIMMQYEEDIKDTNNQIKVGAFDGTGSLIYLLYNFYKLTEDYSYYDEAQEISNKLLGQFQDVEFKNEIDADFISGAAGTLFVMTEIYRDSSEFFDNDILKQVFKKYVSFIEKIDINILGLAHGISGVLLVLGGIYNIVPEKSLIQLINNLSFQEIQLLSIQRSENKSWCRGMAGILFVRKWLKDISDEVDQNPKLKNIQIENLLDIEGECLCHGYWGNADIFTYLSSASTIEKLHIAPTHILLDSIEWIEDSTISWDSFMTGSTGVAYEYLRQLYPDLPSLLRLELLL